MNQSSSITNKSRNASVELLRIIAMWMIVFYHFHYHVLSVESDNILFKAIQIPFHISVPVFVLISGYFGIHFKVSSLSKLLSKTAFYSIIILVFALILSHFVDGAYPVDKRSIVNGIFFVSRTNNLWFIRSYIVLFLVSPFWNTLLKNQTVLQRFYLLLVLFIISSYMGVVGRVSELNGYSIVNFLFIYTIGWTTREYDIANRFSNKRIWLVFVLVMLCSVSLFVAFNDIKYVGKLLWLLFYSYNSIFCIGSAFLFFLPFTKFSIDSKVINSIASSVFAVYLISENSLLNIYIYDVVRKLQMSFDLLPLYLLLVIFSILVFSFAIVIDKISMPIQNLLSNYLQMMLNSLDSYFKKVFLNENK